MPRHDPSPQKLPLPLPLVLVVEDEPLQRVLAALYLEDRRFEVLQAATAAQAIELLSANPRIGAVFSDIDMPGGMNGVGLARWISRERPELTVLLASGTAKPKDVAPWPFLAKPYSMREVERRLRAAA